MEQLHFCIVIVDGPMTLENCVLYNVLNDVLGSSESSAVKCWCLPYSLVPLGNCMGIVFVIQC